MLPTPSPPGSEEIPTSRDRKRANAEGTPNEAIGTAASHYDYGAIVGDAEGPGAALESLVQSTENFTF
jgi:hypothetical protein